MSEFMTATNISIITSSVVLSAIVGGLITLLGGHFQRKADVKAKTRELALTLALDEWKYHCKATEGGNVGVGTPELYMYRYHRILNAMEAGELDRSCLADIQKEVMEIHGVAQSVIEEHRRKNKESQPNK
ncbi:hypothetical protein ACUVNT_002928 [Yersinia enterocolitica]